MYIVIIIILLVLIFYFYFYCCIETFENTQFKILHLVLYSNDTHYDNMYEITREYYKKFGNVHTIYYKYNPLLRESYLLNGDILEIKGNESYIPGILDKTLESFKYFNIDAYDYVIRSNISTIINFDLLVNNLDGIVYGGGLAISLNEQLKNIVVKPNSMYASGTSLIFNNVGMKMLLSNENKINKTLVDDLAIGLLFYDLGIMPKIINDKFVFVDDGDVVDVGKYIFFRNRGNYRNKDCDNMRKIVKKMQQ